MEINEKELDNRIDRIIDILPLRFIKKEGWESARVMLKEGYNTKSKVGVREVIKDILLNGKD